MIYLATSRNVVLQRVHDRSFSEPHAISLTEELAATYFDRFEVSTPDEGPLTVITEAVVMDRHGER
ncbi:hypothetical protein NDR87_33815 [Nocardia sp. CDC159]|uniref:Uncharacterized protein n=1 Tax=Nocardia pulmonis TaxID=2951408 RepID=A0A9X2EDT4_9NOCA|nr:MULTISPECIES: hypothetical protein [Nocardia]MCM6778475.1 hypothetical protein [Nocardia pulmonis]MCM6791364.1 hypothetical protein [Nocardia sp. CDC159]